MGLGLQLSVTSKATLNEKTVGDVLGMPESWPDSIRRDRGVNLDMAGAIITRVLSAGGELAIETKGAVCGVTFSLFIIKDDSLRERIQRALKLGTPVHDAVALAI